MKRNLLVISVVLGLSWLLGCRANADEIGVDVFDADGEYLGEIYTDDEGWRTCSAEDEIAGRCDPVDPVVCMTYSNTCYPPIRCRLEVTAKLAEPYTGFTKTVTDVREEIVFYNSEHHVCFNFSKDQYHLWRLIETGDPIIECSEYTD